LARVLPKESLKERPVRVLKASLALVAGLLLYSLIFQRQVAFAVVSKATGGDEPCPWPALASYPWTVQRLDTLQHQTAQQLKVQAEDKELGIELIQTAGRPFWIKAKGSDLDGRATLSYILAEQSWISQYSSQYSVKPGDIVVDVGAHIGSFDDDALRRGASKCILVEPDPVNVECIRRNFKKEIEQGRIILVPEGAWSTHSTLTFSEGVANSGTGSFVLHENGARTLQVPVRPLDEILSDLGIAKVDFIKMDIEGAEREALRGAMKTLRTSKPRIMLDQYHLPDDSVVLPRIIFEANPAYRSSCSLCSPDRLGSAYRIIPYAVFYF
jgi:FkbM family methyltransferase